MAQRTDFERVHLTAHGAVAVLTLNHPEVMNAASPAMMRSCIAALDRVESDPALRALVLTGEGRAFCSGANLAEAPLIRPDGSVMGAGERLEITYHPFLRRLRDCRVPVVAAVNGPAVGIGMSLALMTDMVVAARSAYFLQAFARIGLVPDGGSSWLLPRLIGLARARELALLAEPLAAEKALAWGLISRVTDDDDVMDSALGLAARLAQGPMAIALARKLFWESPDNAFEVQLGREQAAQQQAGESEDFREGIRAFLEKRPPRFTGS